jgi:hypothetical protein
MAYFWDFLAWRLAQKTSEEEASVVKGEVK